jgi:uncharacterized protein YhaN
MSTQAIVVDTKPFESGLAKFKCEAEAIVVKNQTDYVVACQLALDVRAYVKDVKAKMKPGIDSAKSHLDFLKNEMAKYVTPAETIDQIVSKKAEDWKRAEREAAERERQREQQRVEAEARAKAEAERREAERVAKEQREAREKELEAQRKAGEIGKREQERLRKQAEEDERKAKELAAQQAAEAAKNVPVVKVKAAVPKVSGIKALVNWKFRIVDASKLPRQFLMPDEVAIGQEVRRLKKEGEVIPGVEAYSEDGI